MFGDAERKDGTLSSRPYICFYRGCDGVNMSLHCKQVSHSRKGVEVVAWHWALDGRSTSHMKSSMCRARRAEVGLSSDCFAVDMIASKLDNSISIVDSATPTR